MNNKGTILVVGASGFLGQRLAADFEEYRLVGTYFRHQSSEFIYLDLREQQQVDNVLSSTTPSIVLYAAGLTDVDACERKPDLARRLNAEAVAMIARYPSVRTVYFSTDYVFDGKQGLYNEYDETAPLNEYGLSKLAGEEAVLSENPANLVIRVSGLYNSTGVRNGGSDLRTHIKVYADDIRRSSPVHVDDVVRAVKLLIERNEGGVYHAAGPDVLSRYEFSQLVSLRSLKGVTVLPFTNSGEEGACRPENSSLTSVRLENLGWHPRRVCNSLRPLTGRNSRLDKRYSEALFIDCIGALLSRRTWLVQDAEIDNLDENCARYAVGKNQWRKAVESLGLKLSHAELKEHITSRYVPNPTVWSRLSAWRSDYHLALVNNGPADTFRRWVAKYGLDDVFDILVNSEELGIEKSSPEFFLQVARRLGVRTNNCILIDDDTRNIDAAKKCGIRGVHTVERWGYPISEYVWNTTEDAGPFDVNHLEEGM